MTPENRFQNVQLEWDRSQEALQEARALFAQGLPQWVCLPGVLRRISRSQGRALGAGH